MSAPSDPVISLRGLGAELGISPGDMQRFSRAGHIPKAVGRGNTTLLAAMRGVIAAMCPEAADATVTMGGNQTLAASARICARIAKAAIQAVADRSAHAALRTKVGCAQKAEFAKFGSCTKAAIRQRCS